LSRWLSRGVPTAATQRRIFRELGVRVRRAREQAGLTQEDAAARARIDYKRYQRLEAGSVNATIRTLARVAEAFSVDLWKMLCSG
jgi:transcriptional regulator with XRE-family HTH domain